MSRLKEPGGAVFLDIGCFIGQDERVLVADGADPQNLHAADIVNFWDLGYEFFQDRGRFEAVQWLTLDITHVPLEDYNSHKESEVHDGDKNTKIHSLMGKCDVVYISWVLHAWTWEMQVQASKNLVYLSKGPGSIIIGCNTGEPKGRPIARPGKTIEEDSVFTHDLASFQKQWEQIGHETQTEWRVESRLLRWPDIGVDESTVLPYLGNDSLVLQFVLTRVS